MNIIFLVSAGVIIKQIKRLYMWDEYLFFFNFLKLNIYCKKNVFVKKGNLKPILVVGNLYKIINIKNKLNPF